MAKSSKEGKKNLVFVQATHLLPWVRNVATQHCWLLAEQGQADITIGIKINASVVVRTCANSDTADSSTSRRRWAFKAICGRHGLAVLTRGDRQIERAGDAHCGDTVPQTRVCCTAAHCPPCGESLQHIRPESGSCCRGSSRRWSACRWAANVSVALVQ